MRESDPTKANKVTFDESQLILTQTAAIRSTETVFGRNEGATDTGETGTQVWPLTQFLSICFFVIKKPTFICLEGESMALFGRMLYSLVPSINCVVLVLDSSRTFWTDTAPLKSPRPRTTSDLFRYARRSQDTNTNNLCIP